MARNTILNVTLVSAIVWMAAKCGETSPCTLMAPREGFNISVVPEAVGSAAPGSYALQIAVDGQYLEIEWTVSDRGDLSEPVIEQRNPESAFFEVRIEKTELIDASISFHCPESPLKEVTGTLFVDDVQVDEFAFKPTYDDSQPTEPNGEGCGRCWQMSEGPQVLTGPLDPAQEL